MPAPSRLAVLAILVLSGGCYESHEPELPSDHTCVRYPLEMDCSGSGSLLPAGVCRMRDGLVVAFSTSGPIGDCGEGLAPGSIMLVPECGGPGPPPHATHAITCLVAPESGSLTFVDRESRTATFDPARGACELIEREEPTGPFRPFDEARELCVQEPAWCGAPTLMTLVEPDGDGCGGHGYVGRCDVEIDGARIVLRPEIAPARGGPCVGSDGPRRARCAVRPLAEGTYELALPDGRVVDELVIAGRAAAAPVERRCVPIPR